MDYNNTQVFLREFSRMCKGGCYSCPLFAAGNGKRCLEMIINNPDKVIAIVQKWSEENQREIDWGKVPEGTRVIVSDHNNCELTASFIYYLPQLKAPFLTFCGDDINACTWKYCRLAPDVDPTPYYKD